MKAPRWYRRRRALRLLRATLRLPRGTRPNEVIGVACIARLDSALRGDTPLTQIDRLIEEAR